MKLPSFWIRKAISTLCVGRRRSSSARRCCGARSSIATGGTVPSCRNATTLPISIVLWQRPLSDYRGPCYNQTSIPLRKNDLMKQFVALSALLSISINAYADPFAMFRYADGRTNWQYIANTSASLLILILLIVLISLVRAHLRARRSNRALTEIRATLEDRVTQRTEVLEETAEQLRRREAYISSIVNSMPVMLIGLNDQLQVTQWNKTAEQITGRPFGDVTGQNLWSAYPSITL